MPRPEPAVPARRSSAVPVVAATVGAVLTLVLGTGYAVGRSVVSEPVHGAEERGPVSAWHGAHGVLTADEVSADGLRAQGWTLPTLASDGYRVSSMTRGSVAGHPVVVVRLHRGEDEVVVVEQRGGIDRANPMDGLTGLPVSAEGLERVAVHGVPLWVDAGPPWRAVLVGDAAVYTVGADTGPSAMARTVNLVVADERGRVVEAAAGDSGDSGVVGTVAVGLREIFG